MMWYSGFREMYNIKDIYLNPGSMVYNWKGKQIKMISFTVFYNDETYLIINVPHYFESVGKRRLFIKELDKNILKKRNEKIIKLKERIL